MLDDRREIANDPMRDIILCSLETASENPDWFRTGKATFAFQQNMLGGDWSKAVSEMSSVAVMLAGRGMAEGFKQAVLAQLEWVNADREYCYYADTGKIKYYDNRLTVREGVNAISAQRLGNVAHGLQVALCQSGPGTPGKDPVIHVFPTVPDGWDAEFSLWSHGGFKVTSAIRKGVIVSLSIESTFGGICRLRNPWGERLVSVKQGDREVRSLSGSLFEFETDVGESFVFAVVVQSSNS